MSVFLMPHDRSELISALQQAKISSGKTMIAAGCTDLLVQHPSPLQDAAYVISVLECSEMKVIEQLSMDHQEYLKIGCACTHSAIASSRLVCTYLPALSQSCADIGSVQVRNRGTIGGSLGNASAAGDIYPVMLACQTLAEVLKSDGSVRMIPAAHLIESAGKTCLEEDEIILSVLFPLHEHSCSIFQKLGERSHVSIAKLSLCVSYQVLNGSIQNASAVIGAAGSKAFISAPASAYLNTLSCEALSSPDVLNHLADLLAESIRLSIPSRASLAYKERAIRGLVFQLAQAAKMQYTLPQ